MPWSAATSPHSNVTAAPDELVRTVRRSIAEYGRTLIALPDQAFDLAESGTVTARPGEWWIVVPMWTAEQGRSDLSLELAAVPTHDGHRLEVTDLHVL